MLLRSFKVPPTLLLGVLFLAFFGWQLSQGTKHEESPVGSEAIPVPEGERRPPAPRIALMTFVTEQRSYLHQSLRNKDCKHITVFCRSCSRLTLFRLRPPPWLRLHCRLRIPHRPRRHLLEVQHGRAPHQVGQVRLDMVAGL
jgi:hypothetical protein